MRVPSRGTQEGTFSFFAVLAFMCLLYGVKYAVRRRGVIGFVLMPFLCSCVIYENIVMAIGDLDRNGIAVNIGRACHAVIVPLFLVATFELTYLIHKRRSVNFCGITFDASKRRKKTKADESSLCSTILRFAVLFVATVLLVVGILVNYNLIEEGSSGSGLSISQGYLDINEDWDTHFWLSLVPSLVLWVFIAYFGCRLWNYGTHYSFMVHATCFNPWIWMCVGASALCAGQLCPKEVYPITTNAGELALLLCVSRMFPEIVGELEQQDSMAVFIQTSEKKHSAAARAQIGAAGDYPGQSDSSSSAAVMPVGTV